nr:Asd/ArgC dimerization domain-containing protein [Verrucomicrobium spinosum]
MKRVFASSYQAVSGTGAQAIEELEAQIRDWASADRKWDDVRLAADKVKVYPHQIAFNALPHVDSFLDSGYTKEEMKMENEGRKIMHHPGFRASVTCVRVPVFRAHSVAVSAEFEKPVTVAEARAVLAKAPGLDVVDDPTLKQYPLALDVAGKDNCAVGRLRLDCALDNGLASGSPATSSSKEPLSMRCRSLSACNRHPGRLFHPAAAFWSCGVFVGLSERVVQSSRLPPSCLMSRHFQCTLTRL